MRTPAPRDASTADLRAVPSGASKLWLRTLRRLSRWSGYALVRTPAVPDVTRLDAPTDAVFAHRDFIFEVPLERCRYLYGGTYGPQVGMNPATTGWHPFVAVLHELAARPDLTYEDSVLARFYQRFQPQRQVEVLFPRDVVAALGPSELDRYPMARGFTPLVPWQPQVSQDGGEHGLGPEHGHQSFGPVSAEKGNLEFQRLRATFVSIRDRGYRPELADGEIAGMFVLRGADYRFVVRAGHHRLAALAALGHATVRVGFFKRDPRAVNVESLELWPLVRQGVYPQDLARRFVDQLFDEDQAWRGRELGLV